MGSLSEAFALSQGKATVDAKGVVRGIGSNVISEGPGKALFAVDMDGFTGVLNRVLRETNRSARETVRYGMIEMLRSGRKATPRGAKNRKIISVTGIEAPVNKKTGKALKRARNKQALAVFYQGIIDPKLKFLPTGKGPMSPELRTELLKVREERIKQWKQIERVGIAQRSWGWALQKYCGSGSETLGPRVYHDPIKGLITPLRITVENKLTWINKLVPGIERLMITKASKKMLHNLDNKIKGAFARAAGV